MVRKNWYYNENKNNIPTAINVSSVVRYYQENKKIGIFLAFYRYNQFINAECWIDENSKSFDKFNLINDANFLDDELLEMHMANWLDKQSKTIYDFNSCSERIFIKNIKTCFPDLFEAIRQIVWNEVYS